ncbi:MAG TPA: globin [Acidimicrobiales bacterium]|jgi:hemoglobin|nr:globin [Acidimicrobiales bacterium]
MQLDVFRTVGGESFFFDLVDRFYERVEKDEVLRPLYPEDLEGPKRHLALFLIQYWGGPPTYSRERGHPALRMRHLPFAIGREHRDAWYRAMSASVLEADLDVGIERRFLEYFAMTADHMINVPS